MRSKLFDLLGIAVTILATVWVSSRVITQTNMEVWGWFFLLVVWTNVGAVCLYQLVRIIIEFIVEVANGQQMEENPFNGQTSTEN